MQYKSWRKKIAGTVTAPMTSTQEEEEQEVMPIGKSSAFSKEQIEELFEEIEEGTVSTQEDEETGELFEEIDEGTVSTQEDEESELSLSDDEDEDDMNRAESSSMISKRQIEKLCEDLEDMFTYLTLYIKPAAPLRDTTQEDADEVLPPPIHAISEQFKDLRRHISKLRLQLLPFKERYEEEQAKPDSYEGLDEEEKARKKIDKEEKFFNTYRRSIEYSHRRGVFEQQSKSTLT